MNGSEVATKSSWGVRAGTVITLAFLWAGVIPPAIYASFNVRELEAFDGNQVDLTTWEPITYTSKPATIHQQDCLFIEDNGECTTIDVTVEVGDTVSVQLLEHPMGQAESSLYLTTRAQENRHFVGFDSHYVYLTYSYVSAYTDYGFTAGSGGKGQGGGQIFGLTTHPPLPGQPLTLQIQRTAENRFVSSAYDSRMALIGQPQTSSFSDLEAGAKFYICLQALPVQGGRTAFDNVTIVRAKKQGTAAPASSLDTLSLWQGSSTAGFGETPAPAGQQALVGSTFGQTFRIDQEGWFRLDSISFMMDDYAPASAPQVCQFEVYIMPWSGTRPINQTLYHSPALTTTGAWRMETFQLKLRDVLLAGNVPYVVFFTSNSCLDGVRSDALVASVDDLYPNGGLYTCIGRDFDDLLTQDWSTQWAYRADLAVRLEWSAWGPSSR